MSYQNIVNFLKTQKQGSMIGITQNTQFSMLHRPEDDRYGYRTYDNNAYKAWCFNDWASAEGVFNGVMEAVPNLRISKLSRIDGELSYSPEIFPDATTYIYIV